MKRAKPQGFAFRRAMIGNYSVCKQKHREGATRSAGVEDDISNFI